MDIGTAHDMIEDLMVELAIVRSELFLMTKYRDHYRHIATGYYCDPTESDKYDEMYLLDIGEPSE